MKNNLIFTLDGYKWTHKNMYPPNTEHVYSYFESRNGAQYPYTVFFGLQYLIKKWLLTPITKEMIDEAEEVAQNYFDVPNVFDRSSWDYIVDKYGGLLPLTIKAVAEGTKIPTSNVLLSVVNNDKNTWWLTNAVETLLSHVWASSLVATKSHVVVSLLKNYFSETSDNEFLASYFIHDFSQRGVSSMESAAILGAAHLVNSPATDTLMGVKCAKDYYNANLKGLAFSVRATEHSIQCAEGREKEFEVTKRILEDHSDGILSIVSDSYDIQNAVRVYCTDLKPAILKRNGKFVVRPDSPRFTGDTPENQILWIVQQLWEGFGGTINSKGYKVLDSHTGCIYGDSLTETDIINSLELLMKNGFSAENCVYGQGSGLSQKIHRDVNRNAFKSSAQCRNGEWFEIAKDPIDKSKASKKGKLELVQISGAHGSNIQTMKEQEVLKLESQVSPNTNFSIKRLLVPVFKNGELLVDDNFETIRQRAAL